MTDTQTTADWVLDWRGSTWDSSMLTGHHAAAVAEMLGFPPPWDWFDISELHPLHGPLPLISLIAAFTCVEGDVRGTAARTAVLEAIKGVSLDELADAVRLP
jgi:hypothetical protein